MTVFETQFALGERLDSIVGRWARARPDVVAVQQGEVSLTYAELWDQAGRIAAGLHAAGVRPGDFVTVLLPRCTERVVSLLGALRAGATYIALDPAWPVARIKDIVKRSGSRLTITFGDGPGGYQSLLAKSSGSNRVADLSEGAGAACVYYTSGSTGRPKGVIVSHRGMIRALVANPLVPLDEEAVLLQAANVVWDMHSFELWGALVNGGRSVLLGHEETALDIHGLRGAVAAGVTTLWMASSLFNLFADEDPSAFAGARFVLVGGEVVSPAHVAKVYRAVPAISIVAAYGPAECSMLTSCHPIRPDEVADPLCEVPIGRPIPMTTVRLLDDQGRDVPTGSVGEITIGGVGVGLGYLGDEQETRRRFVTIGAEQYYRSGDLGVADHDGLLRFRGRADRQVKVNGVRVEPGEVEATLVAHPRIGAARVTLLRGRSGQPELACVYRTQDGVPTDPADLREFLSRTLIPAMVPTVLLHVAELPLGPTGKIDPHAVDRMLADHVGNGRTDRLTPNLAALAGDIVGHLAASGDTDLVAAGIGSMDAVRLAARLSTRMGALVSLADVYRLRTLDSLVAAARPGSEDTAIRAGDRTTVERLSRAQERFWLAEQLAPGQADNLLIFAYVLRGSLDLPRLRAAVRSAVHRHSALRTIYPFEDCVPEQRVLDAPLNGLPIAEFAAPPGVTDLRDIAEAVTAPWWSEPFDLAEDGPIRAATCAVDDSISLLCLQIHHIAFDGWSEGILVDDIAAAYQGTPRPETQDEVTYADYSAWEGEHLSTWADEDIPFWRHTLVAAAAAAAAPALPTPSTPGEALRRELTTVVDKDTVARLTAAVDGPPVAALLAATAKAVSRALGRSEVCLGTAVSARVVPQLHDVVGYFVNPLPIVLHGLRDATDADLRAMTATATLAALSHARTPFDEVVRELRPDRTRHPWFQIWSVLQGPRPAGHFADDLTIESIRIPPPMTAIELMFDVCPRPDGSWEAVMFWREDGIDQVTAGTIRAEFDNAIDTLAQ